MFVMQVYVYFDPSLFATSVQEVLVGIARIICITNPIIIKIVKTTIHRVSHIIFSVCLEDCSLKPLIVFAKLSIAITAFLIRSFVVAARSRSIPLPVSISGNSKSFIFLFVIYLILYLSIFLLLFHPFQSQFLRLAWRFQAGI